MQYIQDKEKSALLEQVWCDFCLCNLFPDIYMKANLKKIKKLLKVLNLTESVEKLRVETTEDARKLRTSVSTLQGKVSMINMPREYV